MDVDSELRAERIPRQPPLPAIVRGTGPDVVLLHGYGLTPHTYGRTIDLLAERARVIAPRWLEVEGPWSYDRVLGGLVAALDAARVGRAAFVAHSFGGALSLGLAAHFPKRVRSLVFVDSYALAPHWTMAKDALSGVPLLHRLATRRAAVDFLASWRRRPKDLCRAAWWGFNCRKAEEIAAVREAGIPCHVLWAERRTLLSEANGREFARRLGASFVLVSGDGKPVDHDWMYRRPERFVAELRRVLTELDGRGG